MYKFLAGICLIILIISSCNVHKNEVTKSPKSKAVPDQYILLSDSLISFHQDTLYYGLNTFSGHAFGLYPNDDSAISGSYLNGLEEGVFKKWYGNKKLAESRIYVDGKKERTHQGWWENGHPKFEYRFINGEHEGELKEWYTNGQPYRFFHYRKGYEEGSQKMWWQNGAIRANYVVKSGKKYGLISLKICANPYDSVLAKK